MKRRNFLLASAAFSLLAALPAHAKKKSATEAKPGAAPSASPPDKQSSDKKKTAQKTARKPNSKTTKKNPPDNAAKTPPARPANAPPAVPKYRWRRYEIRSSLVLPRTDGKTRLWLPLTPETKTDWQRTIERRWAGNYEQASVQRHPISGTDVLCAEWTKDVDEPRLELFSQLALRNRDFDFVRRAEIREPQEVLRYCLQPTERVPTDGIVRHTAERAIGRIKDPLAQAKALYDWVIEHAQYLPEASKRVSGTVAEMLENGTPSGRSVDIAQLFVGLCRSVGIPARPVFGLRIDASRLFESLGASGDLSTAQHCRAEFFSPGYGWIPVDPSDVRRAIQEEKLGAGDFRLNVLRRLLFGFWEMNWIGYNSAQDLTLPDSFGGTLPYLGYPVLETPEGRFDTRQQAHAHSLVTAFRTASELPEPE